MSAPRNLAAWKQALQCKDGGTPASPLCCLRGDEEHGQSPVTGTNEQRKASLGARTQKLRSQTAVVDRGLPSASPSGTVTIRMDQYKQTMEGFGYSNAFYTNYWCTHPKKDEIFSLLFDQLQPSIIRLRNTYALEEYSEAEMKMDADFIQAAKARLNYTPQILLTSWSPPREMKVSNTLEGATDAYGNITAILKKDGNGFFRYFDFSKHWVDSLITYAKLGICPDFISPQNEPDYNAPHQSCYFSETETYNIAGYYRAAEEVYDKIMANPQITKKPKMIGPESFGMDRNISQFPVGGGNYFHAIANHLYASGDARNPWSYTNALQTFSNISNQLGVRHRWMSEFANLNKFEYSDPLNFAITIHQVLTVGNVTAYLHWDGAWAAKTQTNEGTLILVENPSDPSNWGNPAGYTVLMNFWWYKHFTNNIRPGYRRVQCDVGVKDVLASAWSGSYGEFAIILINCGSVMTNVVLSSLPSWWRLQTNEIYFSTLDQSYVYAGSLHGNSITLPPTSITSIFSYSKPKASS